MASTIDSLNNLTTDDEELIQKQIREYFEEMELPEEEVEKRIGFATDIEKVFRNLFLLMLGADILGNDLQSNASSYADYAYNRVHDSMVEYGYSQEQGYEPYGYIEQYTKQRCKEIVDTTILHKADSFYLSSAHSIAIAEDETNAIANYDMEQQAIAQGYTMKTWVTMRDKKVRHTHELCDGKTINIFKAFDVGKYQMMFPMDSSLGASMKERANCRCVIEYSKLEKTKDIETKTVDLTSLEKLNLKEKIDDVMISSNIIQLNHIGLDEGSKADDVLVNDIVVSKHILERSLERNISKEHIVDAIERPYNISEVVYNEKNQPSVKYYGKYATVVINPFDRRAVTVWATSTKLREKLENDIW